MSVRASRVRVGDDEHLEAFVACMIFSKPAEKVRAQMRVRVRVRVRGQR